MSMVMGLIKLPYRAVRKIVKMVLGGSDAPAPAAAPAPAPARPRAPEQPAWMRQDSEQEEDDDGHDHGHSHGHSHDHEPEPTAAPAPAEGAVDVFPEDTPNPNAYKFTVNTRVAEKAFSASTLEEAETDLAKALIGLSGVTSIFGVNDFITVTKADSAGWDHLIPAITAAIQANLTA
ncbi:MAG: hypothetical protein ACI8S6_002683 [Myxococcota bacterium]|jgi:hypothetical protein